MVVVRVRRSPGGRDKYGDSITSTASRTALTGCLIAPTAAATVVERGRDGTVTERTLYGPADLDLLHTDQVEIDGVPYDVEGDPGTWQHASGYGRGGVEVKLRRAVG